MSSGRRRASGGRTAPSGSSAAPRLAPWLFVASDPRAVPKAGATLGGLDGAITETKRAIEDGLGGVAEDGASFFESSGARVARLDRYTGELRLLGGPSPETRGTLAPPSRHFRTPGMLFVGGDGVWWTVREPNERSGDLVKLGRHPLGDNPTSRDLFVGTDFHEERALGFLPGAEGTPPHLVLVEGIAGSDARLARQRRRRLRVRGGRPLRASLTSLLWRARWPRAARPRTRPR